MLIKTSEQNNLPTKNENPSSPSFEQKTDKHKQPHFPCKMKDINLLGKNSNKKLLFSPH